MLLSSLVSNVSELDEWGSVLVFVPSTDLVSLLLFSESFAANDTVHIVVIKVVLLV